MEFEYKVADQTGKVLTGFISAESLEEVKEYLRKRDYLILELKEKKKVRYEKALFFKKRINDEELYSFFRELGILLKAGITIDKALEILISSTSHLEFRENLGRVLKGLKEGKSVTQTFRETGIFGSLIISMVSAGESIGNLSQAFSNIADYLKFQIQFKREIRESLTYPVFLVIASLVSLIVIFKFILPRFFSIFGEASLPLPAKILMTLGYFFTGKGFLVTLISLSLLFLLGKFGYLNFFTPYLKEAFFKIPLIRRIFLYLNLSRFSYSMHSMLKSGLDFVDALFLSQNLLSSKELKNFVESCIFEIRKGRSISEAFSSSKILPEIFHHMLKVGEETANLKEIFFELYTIYDEKFKSTLKRVLSLIEPIIITVTGLVVGFIVISLILTVMSAGVIKL